jgi:hypothetical protein
MLKEEANKLGRKHSFRHPRMAHWLNAERGSRVDGNSFWHPSQGWLSYFSWLIVN